MIETVATLPRSQWISPDDFSRQKNHQSVAEDKKRNNFIALIINCVVVNFPELNDCSERKFMNFQEKLKDLVQKELG